MTLRQKQSAFAVLVAKLIREAVRQGYEVTLDEAYHPPETAALYAKQGRGIANSLHTLKLAIDLNLFRNGRFCTRAADYEPLGRWWTRQVADTAWGGDFRPTPDARHFSLRHGGRA